MIRAAEEFTNNPSNGRLIVIFGNYGTGKTHVSKRMVHWVTSAAMLIPLDGKKLVDAWFYSWPEVVDGFKSGEWDVVDSMMNHTLLSIDDIGAEHDPSKVGLDKLCQILSRRENKWTIITTNVQPKMWPEKFDNRIASRMLRNSTLIDMTGAKDYSTI